MMELILDFFLYLGAGLFYLFWVMAAINWGSLSSLQRIQSRDAWERYRNDLSRIKEGLYYKR